VEISFSNLEVNWMNDKEELYLLDYIALGIIGFAIGQAISAVGGIGTVFSGLYASIDWGRTVASDVVSGIFAFLPGGFVAGYLCYKLLKAQAKNEGLTGGIMSFLVYFVITLIMTVANTGIGGGNFGTAMQLWAVLMVFALIFFPIGGLLAGMTRSMKMALPSFLRFEFQRGVAAPPPPPGAAMTCPSCGGPLRYIEQYKRWYCDKEQKYV
jgi:hypothetical protein